MTDEGAPSLPPCGLYRTTVRLGELPAGRLVYFHNHGDPDPGVYLPLRWENNRAVFSQDGVSLPAPWWASTLSALWPEGFYRVRESFVCCERRCITYARDQVVQLGYTETADPLLYLVEQRADGALSLTSRSNSLMPSNFSRLAGLYVPASSATSESR